MPDELYQKVLELHIYYQQAIMENNQAIAQMEAENDFFQDQLQHTDALISGSGHEPSLTEEPQQAPKKLIPKIPKATNRTLRVDIRLSDAYKGMTVISAITLILNRHRGKAFNAADIAAKIFPPYYSREHRAYLHGLVTKELSRGAKDGRFDRANERGYYYCKATRLASV
ncbi:hypothetical protein COO91_01915 [Nostoc flagelliforme CCNUN1]|uniref:Uncharacterized protein n=1 Tax=Nostoc flagelliforme CCNUN1 TaxID=2038116 RepID=A0A2K8SKJ1_9NOSO|nr:hypothetical protein [Nostoc flagelliforme]AUB36016.1 hypothetical protein COO91_01915 [Nostoc flagelliforme CCNUN1]